jgi:hypothetical protein
MEPISGQESLTEYLASIARRDIQGRYVCPENDVEARLEKEVQQRTKCTPANLANDYAAGGTKELRWNVSAQPERFCSETLQVIDEISATLKKEKATQFEIHCCNPQDDSKRWGNQVLIGVRYTVCQ